MNIEDEFLARDVHRTGHFQLSSGKHSDTYLQCALALQDPAFGLELGRRLAEAVAAAHPQGLDLVASPALGGVLAGFVVAAAAGRPFVFTERRGGAMTLRRGQSVPAGARIVVVEDVVTTGGSAKEAADVLVEAGGEVVGYAALVDRSQGFDVTALLRIDAGTWEPDECPLCAQGIALDSPGSRHTR